MAKEMADPAEQSYDRANEFGWKEGDIDIQEPGTVEPLKIQRESSGDGRSRRGRSGNPASKPKGARHHATRAAEALLDGEAEALTRKAIKLARAGDSIVWRLRILPRRRERPLRFVLPELRSSTDVAAAAAAILAAVASGNACVAEAGELLKLANAFAEAAEKCERSRRRSSSRPILRILPCGAALAVF